MERLIQAIKRLTGASVTFAGRSITTVDLLSAAAILIAAVILARRVGRVLDKRLVTNEALTENTRFLLTRGAGALIVCVGAGVSFSVLQFRLTTLVMMFGFFSVGIGFGLRHIVANLVSGVILIVTRPVRVGDIVTVGAIIGTVDAINVRSTLVRSGANVEHFIPNSQLLSGVVSNWTQRDGPLRATARVAVALGSDTELVRRALLELATAHEKTLTEPPPSVRFTQIGRSSVSVELLVWIVDAKDRLDVVSDLNHAIVAAFRANDIKIPYAQRDWRLRERTAYDRAM